MNVEPSHPVTSLRRRLGTALLWVFFGRAATALLTLLMTALAARLFTLAEFGHFVLLLTISMLFSTVLVVGMNQTLVRELAASAAGPFNEAGRALICRARHVFFIASSVFALALWSFSNVGVAERLFGPSSELWCFALFGLTGGKAYELLIGEAFRGAGRSKVASLLGGNVTSVLAVLTLAVFLGMSGPPGQHRGALLFLGLSGIAAAIVSEFCYRNSPFMPAPRANRSFGYSRIFRLSWPVAVSSAFAMALAQADIWTVARLGSAENTAIYGAPARLVSFVSAPHALASFVVLPFIAELYAADRKEALQKILSISATVAGLPAILVLATFCLVPVTILEIGFGPGFREGALVLVILSAGQLINAWVGSCGLALMMTGHQKFHMTITVCIGFLQVAVLLLFFRQLQLTGIAMVASASVALTNIAMWMAARKTLGLWTNASVTRTIKTLRAGSGI